MSEPSPAHLFSHHPHPSFAWPPLLSSSHVAAVSPSSPRSSLRELEAKMIASSLHTPPLASLDCRQLDPASTLRPLGACPAFDDAWSDCLPLWMPHEFSFLARQEVPADEPEAGMATTSGSAIMRDRVPEMELSRSLIAASESPCFDSTVAESQLEPVSLQHASTAPPQSLASASEWSVGVKDSNNTTCRFMEPSSRAAEILQYPLDPTFAERAGKFSSFAIENYSAVAEYPHDQQGTSCADAPVVGHGSSKKPLKSLSGLSSYRRAMDFGNASSRLPISAVKPEVRPSDSIPVRRDLLGADKRLSSSGPSLSSTHSAGGKRRVPQQIDIKTTPPGDTPAFSPPQAPAAGDDAETQDALRLKRGRFAHDEENLVTLHRKVKERDQASIDSLPKRGQNNKPDSKAKEEHKMESRMSERNSDSVGQSSHRTGKNRWKNVGDQPPQLDVIHVRARRGQATDSHSLAERVRREKISERMRLLQDLVPGCNKATGKAMMLDEIINYVQSLQNQVEFLAMKVAALNPRTDLDLDSVMEGEVEHTPSICLIREQYWLNSRSIRKRVAVLP